MVWGHHAIDHNWKQWNQTRLLPRILVNHTEQVIPKHSTTVKPNDRLIHITIARHAHYKSIMITEEHNSSTWRKNIISDRTFCNFHFHLRFPYSSSFPLSIPLQFHFPFLLFIMPIQASRTWWFPGSKKIISNWTEYLLIHPPFVSINLAGKRELTMTCSTNKILSSVDTNWFTVQDDTPVQYKVAPISVLIM